MAESKFFYTSWFIEELPNNYSSYFTCQLANIKISQPNQQIVLPVKDFETHTKVQAVSMDHSCSTAFFPIGLGLQFPNITYLKLKSCGLLKISRINLRGLDKLKGFSLLDNKIEDLAADLFLDQKMLEIVDFYNNSIKTIAEQVLAPLKNLKFCDFRKNINIDMCFSRDKSGSLQYVSLDTMNRHIKERCQLTDEDPVRNYIQQLWEGNCSDFVIEVGAEEFKVHKSILAVNSPVFEAMFRHDLQENHKNKMKIVDFPAEVVESFLEFIYLRKMSKLEMNFLELYSIAAKYQVEELKKITKSTLMQNLSQDNAYEIFLIGHLHEDEFMKSQAFSHCSQVLGGNLHQNLMKYPEKVKTLLEAKALKDSTIASVEAEWAMLLSQQTNFDDM